MIHHLMLLTTKPDVVSSKIEDLMVETRIRLLKLPDINNLRVGKRVDLEGNPYTWFFSFDIENMDKLAFVYESAIFIQYERQVITPFIASSQVFDYEMEPGKDVRYS